MYTVYTSGVRGYVVYKTFHYYIHGPLLWTSIDHGTQASVMGVADPDLNLGRFIQGDTELTIE